MLHRIPDYWQPDGNLLPVWFLAFSRVECRISYLPQVPACSPHRQSRKTQIPCCDNTSCVKLFWSKGDREVCVSTSSQLEVAEIRWLLVTHSHGKWIKPVEGVVLPNKTRPSSYLPSNCWLDLHCQRESTCRRTDSTKTAASSSRGLFHTHFNFSFDIYIYINIYICNSFILGSLCHRWAVSWYGNSPAGVARHSCIRIWHDTTQPSQNTLSSK